MIGRVSTLDLGALSLTESWLYSFMLVAWTAVSMTLGTLVSQAHGARAVPAMRAWALLSLAASLALACVVAAMWVAAPAALSALGFDPALAARGQQFALAAMPVLALEAFNLVASGYLLSMQLAMMPLAVGLLAALVDVPATYLLVYGAAPEVPRAPISALAGSGIGWSVSAAVAVGANCLALRWALGRGELQFGDDAGSDAYSNASESGDAAAAAAPPVDDDEHDGEGGRGAPLLQRPPPAPSVEDDSASATMSGKDAATSGLLPRPHPPSWWRALVSQRRWRVYLALLLPNMAAVALGNAPYTVVSLLAAGLGTVEVATHNALICVFEIVHAFSTGMAEATAVRVGAHLGRGDVRAARRTAAVALTAAFGWGLCVAAAGYGLHGYVAHAFSDDAALLAQAQGLRAIMWGAYALVSLGDAAAGVLEGQGRSLAQAAATVAGVLVCVPLAVASVRATTLGLPGLWGAMLVGYGCVDALCLALVWASQWDALAQEAVATAGAADEVPGLEEEAPLS